MHVSKDELPPTIIGEYQATLAKNVGLVMS